MPLLIFIKYFIIKNMKKFTKIITLIICTYLFTYCNNEDSISNVNDSSSQNHTSEYYIKYTAARPGYSVSNACVKIKNEYEQIIDIVTDKTHFKGINQTIGPVKKGFTATINVTPSMNLEISCSKDNGPFVEKVRATSAYGISYTIDY